MRQLCECGEKNFRGIWQHFDPVAVVEIGGGLRTFPQPKQMFQIF